jgi:hypothetical protein
MPKAICVLKMKTTAGRGQPDVPVGVSFVHCGGVVLPGNYKAFIVTGTAAQLTNIAAHTNFLCGQAIAKNGDVYAWADSKTAIAAGARTKINNWLVANGHPALTAQNSIVDLIHVFQPGYIPSEDDVSG